MNITAILESPEYFHCNTLRCTLKKTTCIERQTNGLYGKRKRKFLGDLKFIPASCEKCEQGRQIKNEMEGKNMAKEKTSDSVCIVYGCDNKATARGELCSGHYKKWRKGEIDHPQRGKWKPSGEEMIDQAKFVIDLGPYVEHRVLERLQQAAHEDIRTPKEEIVYLIIKALKERYPDE